MAAVLAAGPTAYASRRGAGGLYGAPGFLPGRCEITVVGARPRLGGVVVHRVAAFGPADITTRLGIPTTTAARLVVDAAMWLQPAQLARVLDHVLRRRYCLLDDVIAARERAGRVRGRSGLQRLIEERQEGLRPGDSDWEVKLMKLTIDAGLPPPVQQHEVVVNGRVFFIDAAWPDRKVGLEFLGFDVHGTRTAFDHDAERTALLTAIGWTMVPATSRSRPAAVLGTLRRLLR